MNTATPTMGRKDALVTIVAFTDYQCPFCKRVQPTVDAVRKFWQMHERLYEDPRAVTDENIEKYARELGLDMKKFARDLQNPEVLKRIKAEQLQGAVVGARGTPAFFVTGRFLSGAQPLDAFKTSIDAALVEARKKVKSGTPRKSLYKALMKDALTKV